MTDEKIKVNVFRYDPAVDQEPYYQTYNVPWEPGMSAMTALDYIYNHLDGTLAYYDHAGCDLGICSQCTGKINGKSGLFCQTAVKEEITLEPRKKERVLKDLITQRAESSK